MRIGLMVEGQNGLTWERWIHICRLAERLGFPTLFRSDHFFIGQEQESLEAYLSLAVAARETTCLRFGPLVTPVTFRAPVNVARMAAQLDALSGGRFVLGLGAGWNESEHRVYGIPFPPLRERMDRLEEALQLTRALWAGPGARFDGRYYRLDGADCLPRPPAGRPPILVGGAGERRTLALVARYADEWNAVNLAPEAYAAKAAVLARHCEAAGRDPATIRRSMMAFGVLGPTPAALDAATRLMQRLFPPPGAVSLEDFRQGLRRRGFLVGSTAEVVDHLGRLAAAGLEEVQFQHVTFDVDDLPHYLAAEIAPAVASF